MKTLSLRLRFLAAWVLTAAFLLCGNFTLQHWYSLWNSGSFLHSSPCLQLMDYKIEQATSLGELLFREGYYALPFLESEMADQLAFELMPENTNFRFSLHTANGTRICDNTGGQHVSDVADGVTLFTFMTSFTIPDGAFLQEKSSGILVDGDAPSVEKDGDVTIVRQSLVMEYGLAKTLTAEDDFVEAEANFRLVLTLLPVIALAALVCFVGAVAATVFFCLGLRKTDQALKKPPFDLLFLLLFLASGMLYNLAEPALHAFLATPWKAAPLLASAAFDGAQAALWLVGLAAFVYQWRRGLWKNCLIYRWCAALGRKLRAAWSGLRLSRRPAMAFFIYLACTMLLGLLLYVSLFDGGGAWPFFLLLFILFQWAALRLSLGMERDRQAVIAETVEREIRAQRFQAELITNVSHDLRSPLTSLINYVDLLKKAGPNATEAAEYLDVLERKSHRLKKLTDDLIEASKASSGVLPVNLEPLGLKELAQQALAEYDDRFAAAGLTLVMNAPREEVTVTADGRHLWRVLDNLLSNCAKYSLPGSRVYFTIIQEKELGVITLKNISAESLNIPADELMSRFVRGDHSRTDGGSGLGLSIAESLTKLQNGSFTLDIDGDLFKATVALPLAVSLAADQFPEENADE